MPAHAAELADYMEHLERYRAVTLQVLDVLESDDDLRWRPGPAHYSLGQQLLHIAQSEDLYSHGLFEGDWNFGRARFPERLPDRSELRTFYREVRAFTLDRLANLEPDRLSEVVDVEGAPMPLTLRSWLWFVLEHEIHHKGQIWTYLRQMGYVAPFYAMPLPLGERPDIPAREQLGGFR